MPACMVQTAAAGTSWTLLGAMSAAAVPSRKSQATGIWAGEQAQRSKRHTASKYDFIKVKCSQDGVQYLSNAASELHVCRVCQAGLAAQTWCWTEC